MLSGFPDIDLKHDCLLLDVDGTLIDIAPTPEAVVVPESLRLSLHRLWDRMEGRIALVSGRPLLSIDTLFAPLHLPASGTHGAELRADPLARQLSFQAQPLPAGLFSHFSALEGQFAGLRIEDKHFSIAFHYRAIISREAEVIAAVTQRMADIPSGYELLRGKAIVEIRPVGVNKGAAVRRLLAFAPFAGYRPVFFGDDVTDEDCIAVLPEFSGIGVSVGCALTGARYHVTSPADVRDWLVTLSGL